MMKNKRYHIVLWLLIVLLLAGCQETSEIDIETQVQESNETTVQESNETAVQESEKNQAPEELQESHVSDIPDYYGEPFIVLNNNIPSFNQISTESYESYSQLDALGRVGVAEACIGQDIMPTEERGAIGQVKPTGWHTVKYDHIDGMYLYNRCHLIGFQLTGENANEENLMTGTRYLNTPIMLEYENMVADYVRESKHHVMYRVTPVYEGENLLATGVIMEGYSVEDEGKGVQFHVFVYNEQPGVTIDHATGESWLSEDGTQSEEEDSVKSEEDESIEGTVEVEKVQAYVLNTNTKKIHHPSCSSATDTLPKNRKAVESTLQELENQGYEPCKRCH